MVLVLLVTGLAPPTSNLVQTVLLQATTTADKAPGTMLVKLQHSTVTLMATHHLVEAEVAVEQALPVEVELVHGRMASTLLAQPTLVRSVSFSVYQTTQPSNKPVSTSRSTMISQLRLLAKTSLSQFSPSPTLLSMTIS